MTVFKVGDKVKQSADSSFRKGTKSNPVDVVGEVSLIKPYSDLKNPSKVA